MFYYLPYMEENANQGKFNTTVATVIFRIVKTCEPLFICYCAVYYNVLNTCCVYVYYLSAKTLL